MSIDSVHKQHICIPHYVCCLCVCVFLFVCIHVCVCFSVCVYPHSSTINKHHQTVHSLPDDMATSEGRPANLCIHMTKFNQNIIVPKTSLSLYVLDDEENWQSCSLLWYIAVLEFSVCFARSRASLTNEQHSATHWQPLKYLYICWPRDTLVFRMLAAPDSLDKLELCWIPWIELMYFPHIVYSGWKGDKSLLYCEWLSPSQG